MSDKTGLYSSHGLRLERSDLKVKEFYYLCSENKGAPYLRLCKNMCLMTQII